MSNTFNSMVKNQSATEGKKSDGEDGQKRKSEFNLQDAVDDVLRKMKKDKGDDPEKKIPDGFEEFIRSQGFRDFLEAMLDYNKELFRLENKQ